MYSLKNKSISILIVEDNPLDTLIVQTLLQPHFNIETVSNGNDALNIIEEIKFDIVLMDINLGDDELNGIHVMKLIKEKKEHKHMKFFAVAAFPESDRDYYIDQGFDELFIKPVIKEEIFEYIDKVSKNTSFSSR